MNHTKHFTSLALIGGCIIVAAMIMAVISQFENRAQATFYPAAQSASTINATLLSATTSNVTGSALSVESVNQHTLQISTLCTNAASNIISGSLDGSGWVALTTNSTSASLTNAVTLNQRWTYLRSTFGVVGTGYCAIVYLGGKN